MKIGSPDYSPIFGVFPLAHEPTSWAWLTEVVHGQEHRVAAAVQKSHPASGGLWGAPAASRDAAQRLPSRRAAGSGKGGFTPPEAAQTPSVTPVLGVPRAGLAAAGVPSAHPGCAARFQPCCAGAVPVLPLTCTWHH